MQAACNFNDGFSTLLKMMEMVGVRVGQQGQMFADYTDKSRIQAAEHAILEAMKPATTATKLQAVAKHEFYEEAERLLCSAETHG